MNIEHISHISLFSRCASAQRGSREIAQTLSRFIFFLSALVTRRGFLTGELRNERKERIVLAPRAPREGPR